MPAPTLITFSDPYTPDDRSIASAVAALEATDPVAVRWPDRTTELLQRKEAGRATILDDLISRGGDARGVEQFDTFLRQARHFAAATDRLPQLWRSLAAVSASADEASFALRGFVRFANLRVLNALTRIGLEGEELALEDDLREKELHKLFNSPTGQRALETRQSLYAVDVEVTREKPGNYIYAPASLIEDLRVGHTVHGELLSCWTVPQSEVYLLGTELEADYRELKIWHVRDDSFEEI